MASRRAVGSLIGIGFLLMIIAVGVSYYTLWEGVDRRSEDILQDMMQQDRDAADENLEIQYVALTGGNSLNLTIKNTGNIISQLEWIGVFDETLNSKNYFGIETSLNPLETQIDIGNASILMNPANTYIIQVLTRLGNIYYSEYPMPVTPGGVGGGGNTTSYYFSDYTQVDLYNDTAVGTHSFFSAMKAGPDGLLNNLTEAIPVFVVSNVTLINNESFEGVWLPAGWSDVPPGTRWNQESNQVYDGVFSADFDGGGGGRDGDLLSPVFDCSDASTIYLEFWYYNDGTIGGQYLLDFYNGTAWVEIADLGAGAQNQWLNYQIATSDPQFQIVDFQIQWRVLDLLPNEHVYLDLVNAVKASGGQPRYELDLEVQWSGLPAKTNEYLMIYGGSQGAESLQVDVWDGVQWVTLIGDVQTGWNNVDVSSYLTGATFNIRFKDTTQIGDLLQENWEIDALFLNLFD